MKMMTKVVNNNPDIVQQAQSGLDKVLEILDKHPHPTHEYALGVMQYAFEYGELYAEDHSALCEFFNIKLL